MFLQTENNSVYGKDDDDDDYYSEDTAVVDTNDYYESSQPSKKAVPPKKAGVFVLSGTATKIEDGKARPVRRKVSDYAMPWRSVHLNMLILTLQRMTHSTNSKHKLQIFLVDQAKDKLTN